MRGSTILTLATTLANNSSFHFGYFSDCSLFSTVSAMDLTSKVVKICGDGHEMCSRLARDDRSSDRLFKSICWNFMDRASEGLTLTQLDLVATLIPR